MRNKLPLKSIIGFLPAAIVLIPFVTACIRQSLYYSGCMDGITFMVAAYFGFMAGGILNLIFLVSQMIWRQWFKALLTRRQKKIQLVSVIIAVLTLVFQVGFLVLWQILE